MQNYRTEEDIWKLVSPPCGIKGEGAFAELFTGRTATAGEMVAPVVVFDEIEEVCAAEDLSMVPCSVKISGACNDIGSTYASLYFEAFQSECLPPLPDSGSVHVHITTHNRILFPQARPDFMTSALVNAIDRRGFVEFSKKDADGDCSTQQCATPSAIT